MNKLSWTGLTLVGVLSAGLSGCGGGGNNTITPASETYVRGNYTGTLVDPANVFGEGNGATATLQYNDTTPSTTGNGTLVFTTSKGPVTIPINFNTYYETTYIAFTISLVSNPDEDLVDSGTTGLITSSPANTYSGTGAEYTFPSGPTPDYTNDSATVTVTYQGATTTIRK